jgi:hypothetical protein
LSKKISQREAKALRKRVAELERHNEQNASAWAREYIGGVNINTIAVKDVEWHIISTARKLGHAVIVLPTDNFKLLVYAVKP